MKTLIPSQRNRWASTVKFHLMTGPIIQPSVDHHHHFLVSNFLLHKPMVKGPRRRLVHYNVFSHHFWSECHVYCCFVVHLWDTFCTHNNSSRNNVVKITIIYLSYRALLYLSNSQLRCSWTVFQILYDHIEKCYKAYMDGSDVFEEEDLELKTILRMELYLTCKYSRLYYPL